MNSLSKTYFTKDIRLFNKPNSTTQNPSKHHPSEEKLTKDN